MSKKEQLFVCGGCNAKIGPGKLSKLLKDIPIKQNDRLLVGFENSDDASVIMINPEQALIQTVDFFPPMVSDPYLFGQIAAANALSDIYAMGGTVLTALNIVAFPEEKDVTILAEILRGGAEKVMEAGAVMSGGHSIHDPTIKYGLAVSGIAHPDAIYRNNTSRLGDVLILTKPLGVGIVTSGYQIGEVDEAAFELAVKNMTMLNKYAMEVIRRYPISSCTDVTGFGLLGHLHEMLGNRYSARLDSNEIPYIKKAYEAANNFVLTAGGQRNRNYLEAFVDFKCDDFAIEELLFDPQTSGGLLVSVPQKYAEVLVKELEEILLVPMQVFGEIIEKQTAEITIL